VTPDKALKIAQGLLHTEAQFQERIVPGSRLAAEYRKAADTLDGVREREGKR
jgi:hypothetical protein